MTTFNRDDSLDLPVLAAAPEAPEVGRKKLYVGDDGQFYAIDDQGNVTALQAASGSTATRAAVTLMDYEGTPPLQGYQETIDLTTQAPAGCTFALLLAYVSEEDDSMPLDVFVKMADGSPLYGYPLKEYHIQFRTITDAFVVPITSLEITLASTYGFFRLYALGYW